MSGLTLSLFGSPSLARDGVPLQLHSRKCMALLAYLAVTGSNHSREALAALFWPEMGEGRARAALRSTLSRLRGALGGAWLAVDWETIGLDPGQEPVVDVVRFRSLLVQCSAHGHSTDEACPQCLPLLAEAADLCRADFLTGFTLRDSPQFDDWQSLEAQALRREMASVLERLGEGYAAEGSVERAIGYAQRWAGLDPLDEAAHRCLMRLYAGSGQQAAALHQYEAVEKVLKEELGVSPGAQTVELYQAIKAGEMSQLQVTSPTPHNLPPQPTPFVGREEELAQIAQLLAEPSCRLLSVVGPGGIGKTRLAIQAAGERAHRFAHGVYFVPLVSLASAEPLAFTILEALDIPLATSLQPREQLLNILRERRLLLILDNFEHLLEGSALLAEMVQAAPGLKLLVTSRERLGLRDEWLFPLRGMRFPGEQEIQKAMGAESGSVWPGATPEASLATLGEFNALQLFVQCARRVRPDFTLATGGASWVGRICRLVEGMPLAIELAAPWVRAMPCREIAREIEGGLGFLATKLRDMPQRHRSMRAVFDHSWARLSAEERDVLGRLSVFRGGFRREAAEAVAARLCQSPASLGVLPTLLDRSWLRATPSGRYEMHELVRQYCGDRFELEPLVEGQRASVQVRDDHSRYYAAFLQGREERLHGGEQAAALQEILEDMDNVWAAWRWAVERGYAEVIGRSVVALGYVGRVRGWYHEGSQAFEEAAAMLRQQLDLGTSDPSPSAREGVVVALAAVLSRQAYLYMLMGLRQQAMELAKESLALVQEVEHDPRRDRMYIHAALIFGNLLRVSGDAGQGRRHFREALAYAEDTDDRWGRQEALYWLGIQARYEGRYSEAEGALQQAIAIADETGERLRKAGCLGNLSHVLYDQGAYQEARGLAKESLKIREEVGDRRDSGYSFVRLGEVATALGDYGLAEQYLQRSDSIADEIGDPNIKLESLRGQVTLALALRQPGEAQRLSEDALTITRESNSLWMRADALVGLGRATCALGQVEEARRCFHQALGAAMELGRLPAAASALMGIADLLIGEGDPEQAAELLGLVLHHPATHQIDKDTAKDLLAELKLRLSPEAFAAAIARGQPRELEEVVAEILEAQVDTDKSP